MIPLSRQEVIEHISNQSYPACGSHLGGFKEEFSIRGLGWFWYLNTGYVQAILPDNAETELLGDSQAREIVRRGGPTRNPAALDDLPNKLACASDAQAPAAEARLGHYAEIFKTIAYKKAHGY